MLDFVESYIDSLRSQIKQLKKVFQLKFLYSSPKLIDKVYIKSLLDKNPQKNMICNMLTSKLMPILYGLVLYNKKRQDWRCFSLIHFWWFGVRTLHYLVDGQHEKSTFLCQDYSEIVELVRGFVTDICHIYREANYIDHNLARFGANCPKIYEPTLNCPL